MILSPNAMSSAMDMVRPAVSEVTLPIVTTLNESLQVDSGAAPAKHSQPRHPIVPYRDDPVAACRVAEADTDMNNTTHDEPRGASNHSNGG